MSSLTSDYRDGVLSAATPSLRYGTLTSTFENGVLGSVGTRKGSSMSGVIRDGILGSAYEDGVLGKAGLRGFGGAFRSGSLGEAYRDGSLGLVTGRTGKTGTRRPGASSPVNYSALSVMERMRGMRGLSGGCGCSGMGDDAAVPFYKKPLYLAGAAVAAGVVFYIATKKK